MTQSERSTTAEPDEGDVVVRAVGLRKTYGRGDKALEVLRGIDLHVRRGEVLALLGPNGAGKTTTVRILATLLRASGGSATVAGFDLVTEPARVKTAISLTGQQVAIDDLLTGRENLDMVARLAHLPPSEVPGRVAELLERFDLEHAADRRVGTYSGGMRRRIDLAAGLVRVPQVLFLDEPTTGLDPRSRRALWDVVREVAAAGTAVFLTTQYLEEADELADRIAVIDDGRVIAEGTASQLKAQVGTSSVVLEYSDGSAATAAAEAIGTIATAAGREVHLRTDGTLADVRETLGVVDAAGVAPEHWTVRAPTLDDVFLTLTGRPAEPAAPGPEDEHEESAA